MAMGLIAMTTLSNKLNTQHRSKARKMRITDHRAIHEAHSHQYRRERKDLYILPFSDKQITQGANLEQKLTLQFCHVHF